MSLLPAVNDKLNRTMQILRASLEEEVQRDYVFALKQSIGRISKVKSFWPVTESIHDCSL